MLVLMRLMSRTYAIMKYALLSDWKYECKDPTSVIHEQQQEQSFSFVIAASPNPAEVVVGLRFVGCVTNANRTAMRELYNCTTEKYNKSE